MADLDPARIPELDARLSTLAPVDRLRWAYETFGARAGIGTSFQPAGVVILHLAKTAGPTHPGLHPQHRPAFPGDA